MSEKNYDLYGMPVVQTLQMIIDGEVIGDEAAGILRDAVSAQNLAESVIRGRRNLIERAEQRLIYGKDGKPDAGAMSIADGGSYVANYSYSKAPADQAVQAMPTTRAASSTMR